MLRSPSDHVHIDFPKNYAPNGAFETLILVLGAKGLAVWGCEKKERHTLVSGRAPSAKNRGISGLYHILTTAIALVNLRATNVRIGSCRGQLTVVTNQTPCPKSVVAPQDRELYDKALAGEADALWGFRLHRVVSVVQVRLQPSSRMQSTFSKGMGNRLVPACFLSSDVQRLPVLNAVPIIRDRPQFP